jgi:hypothetical protein
MVLMAQPQADQGDDNAGHVLGVHEGGGLAGATGHQDGAGDLEDRADKRVELVGVHGIFNHGGMEVERLKAEC